MGVMHESGQLPAGRCRTHSSAYILSGISQVGVALGSELDRGAYRRCIWSIKIS